jgi:lipopolysaccharide transport system ATP-binding protein
MIIMSSLALKVENLSKLYRLGEVGTGTLSHDLNRWWYKVRGKEDPYKKIGEENYRERKGDSDYVWALRNINLEVEKGEILGIVGKNGAGKSTLLKILSQVTEPTEGVFKIKGRLSSLLEVGVGFHADMTGRENVFLNAAINGMTRSEVKAQFDEIVDFAGVERYIDTPIKRYSSGMRVRLGFAVAAFFRTEILVVDEVLAVGDAQFQEKALGKMADLSEGQGRTVLFVSHDLPAVKNLCTRGVLLESGQIVEDGAVGPVIDTYLSKQNELAKTAIIDRTDRSGNQRIIFQDLKLFDAETRDNVVTFQQGQHCIFRIFFRAKSRMRARIDMGIKNSNGERICWASTHTLTGKTIEISSSGKYYLDVEVQKLPLIQGEYNITLYTRADGDIADWLPHAFTFRVVEGDYYNTGKIMPYNQGKFLLDYDIQLHKTP